MHTTQKVRSEKEKKRQKETAKGTGKEEEEKKRSWALDRCKFAKNSGERVCVVGGKSGARD